MNPIIIISVTAAIFFGLSAIFLSFKKDNPKKEKEMDGKTHDEFLHMMVHELRAPLTSIKDSSELLVNSKAQLRDDEKDQFAKMINRQAKVLLEQITSILDAAKFENGTFVLSKKEENIGDLIHEKIKDFEPQAEKKNITISLHIEGPIPVISIDGLRIGQVINNLISNSIKFTPDGGAISVSVRIANDSVEVSVSDTGVGIPRELQANIFSKFYQVKTLDRLEEKNGSGLGLYIVKKIIDAHGGHISVFSDHGKGTTMIFTLPLSVQGQTSDHIPPAQYTIPN
jgi:signal transduction histidine kinase